MTPAKTTDRRALGACLCGAVTFSFAVPPKWVAHCHCSMCRRAHGAPYVTWVGVDAADFTVTDGAHLIGRYKSSAPATREFCTRCGASLFFRSERWPTEVHVARAAIPGDIDKEPTAHVFFSDKAKWVHVNDELTKKGGKTGVEPLDKRG